MIAYNLKVITMLVVGYRPGKLGVKILKIIDLDSCKMKNKRLMWMLFYPETLESGDFPIKVLDMSFNL